jgi:hypothetical protein
MANSKTDTLAATGASTPIVLQTGFLQLSGTWAGTANLQTGPNPDGSWSNVTDGTGAAIALTANTNCPVDNAIAMNMRVNWTRTSGTLVVTLTSNLG